MTSVKKTLVAYSINIESAKKGDTSEDVDNYLRYALVGLLQHAARRIENGEPKDITLCNRVSIEIEEEHWDQKFVFKLERVKDD